MNKDVMFKRGVSPIIATVLLILLVLVTTGVISYYVIPLVSDVDASCVDALQAVEFQDLGYTCFVPSSETGDEDYYSFSVRVREQGIEGFSVGFTNEGSADTYAVVDGRAYEPLCSLDSEFGLALDAPEVGEVRTYVIRNTVERVFISPILEGGKECYREGRIDTLIERRCVDPEVKNRILECSGVNVPNTYCGDNIVQSPNDNGEFEQCDDGANGNDLDGCTDSCQSVSLPSTCILSNARWSITQAIEGMTVTLHVDGSEGCAGQTLNYSIWEDDLAFDEIMQTHPVSQTFANGQVTLSSTWTTQWQNDGIGDPEYYFEARRVGTSDVIYSPMRLSEELKVSRLNEQNPIPICGDEVCSSGETVASCPGDCDVSEAQCGNNVLEQGEDCESSSLSISCTINFYSGTQSCNLGTCLWDSCQASEWCGDGIVNGNEICDGTGIACTIDEPRGGSTTITGQATGVSGGGQQGDTQQLTRACLSDCSGYSNVCG